jgi:hypothetical protein
MALHTASVVFAWKVTACGCCLGSEGGDTFGIAGVLHCNLPGSRSRSRTSSVGWPLRQETKGQKVSLQVSLAQTHHTAQPLASNNTDKECLVQGIITIRGKSSQWKPCSTAIHNDVPGGVAASRRAAARVWSNQMKGPLFRTFESSHKPSTSEGSCLCAQRGKGIQSRVYHMRQA